MGPSRNRICCGAEPATCLSISLSQLESQGGSGGQDSPPSEGLEKKGKERRKLGTAVRAEREGSPQKAALQGCASRSPARPAPLPVFI